MLKNTLTVIIAGVVLTACAGQSSKKVASLQKKDKSLTCSEVQLEINEAEYYRKSAEGNKAPGISSVIMPVGYISTYMDANTAVKAADERIDYLNRIYDIRKCDDAEQIHTQQMKQRSVQRHAGAYAQPVYAQPAYAQPAYAQPRAPMGYAQNPYVAQAPVATYQPMSMQSAAPYQQNAYYNADPVPAYMIDYNHW
jgi:hypothetical protein